MGRQRFFKCHVLYEVFRILCLQAHPTNIQWIARAVLAIYHELARHLKVLAQSAWRRDHFPLPPPCSNGRTSSLDHNWIWLRMKLGPQTAQSRWRPWSNFIRGSSLTFLHMVFTWPRAPSWVLRNQWNDVTKQSWLVSSPIPLSAWSTPFSGSYSN